MGEGGKLQVQSQALARAACVPVARPVHPGFWALAEETRAAIGPVRPQLYDIGLVPVVKQFCPVGGGTVVHDQLPMFDADFDKLLSSTLQLQPDRMCRYRTRVSETIMLPWSQADQAYRLHSASSGLWGMSVRFLSVEGDHGAFVLKVCGENWGVVQGNGPPLDLSPRWDENKETANPLSLLKSGGVAENGVSFARYGGNILPSQMAVCMHPVEAGAGAPGHGPPPILRVALTGTRVASTMKTLDGQLHLHGWRFC